MKKIPHSEVRKAILENKRRLEAKGFDVVEMRECQWKQLAKRNDIAAYLKTLKSVQPKRQLSFHKTLEGVKNGTLYGFLLVDIHQRWALPQIRKLRTQVSICGFANLISYHKYLWICGEKLEFTANPHTNRQCCLIRGKTARKKWTLLSSGLEVNDRELMTFFFLEVNVWPMAKFDLRK